MAWTTPKTWSSAAITAAEFNTHIRDNENWLKGAFTQLNVTSDSAKAKITPALVGCRAYKAATQTIATTTQVPINLDAERFDSDGFHSTSVNNNRITIPSGMDGYYITGGSALFAAHATGTRQMWVYVNGIASGFPITGVTNIPGAATAVYMTTGPSLYQLAATDYIELVCYQNSGGNLDVTAVASTSPELWMHRMKLDMIDLPTRKVIPADEVGTIRVPVDGISAIALNTAYKRLVAAQDEVVTIQAFLCREKGITADQVVGFDDERGELIVRP